jgi:hypothetical protein
MRMKRTKDLRKVLNVPVQKAQAMFPKCENLLENETAGVYRDFSDPLSVSETPANVVSIGVVKREKKRLQGVVYRLKMLGPAYRKDLQRVENDIEGMKRNIERLLNS